MKKILSIILVIITLVALAVPIVATETISGVDITKSSVTEDLETIYNLSDYKADSGDKGIYLITVMEYGYGTSDRTLYLYFYNPSRKALSNTSFNKVELACSFDSSGKPAAWKKQPISIVSISKDNLLVKCKLGETSGKYYLDINGSRYYSISGVELHSIGDDFDGVTDYKVGYTYAFSGSGDSLTCNRTDELTISLDVHQTSYLTGDSAKGEGYSNQINSVYFSIPQEIEQEYGNLYAVDFEYYKYRTAPIILTDNQTSYNLLMLNRGLKASKGLFLNADSEEYYLFKSDQFSANSFVYDCFFGQIPFADFYGTYDKYNERLNVYEKYERYIYNQNGAQVIYDVKSGNLYDYIFNVFKVDSLKNSANSEERKKILVSANELQKYFKNYNGADPFGKKIGSNNYAAVLFESSVLSEDYSKENHYVTGSYTLENEINLPSWVDANYRNWFIHLINGEWGYVFNKKDYDNTVENLSALELVTAKKLSSETVADDLKVSSSDVEALDEFCTRKSAAGENTYLFRYAWTDDYYSAYLTSDNLDGNFLMVEETVYLDFDIISLSFKKNEKITVIPVVADPTDGFTGIQNTVPDNNLGDNVADKLGDLKDSLKNWWKDSAPKLLGLGILIIAIVGIAYLCVKIPSWIYGKSDTSDSLFSDKKDKDKENNTTVNITIQEDELKRRSNYNRGQYRGSYRGSYRYNGRRQYNSRYRYNRNDKNRRR